MARPSLLGLAVAAACAACGAADRELDPGVLEARDLLGVHPAVAARWSPAQRAAARRVLAPALAGHERTEALDAPLGLASDRAQAVLATLHGVDFERAERALGPLGLVEVSVDGAEAAVEPVPWPAPGPGPALLMIGWEAGDAAGWADLPARAPDLLEALAAAGAGAEVGAVRCEPAPQAPVGAVYLTAERRLLVNPVVLAAAEPAATEARGPAGSGGAIGAGPARRTAAGGNPYSFYGSVGECAAAQRERCDDCLPDGSCRQQSRDATDGNAECTALAAEQGRGYFLFCANLALAIATVADCAAERAGGCAAIGEASNQLAHLEANAEFVDDPTCAAALDACLADLYGAPTGTFPGPAADGGLGPDAGAGPGPDGGGGTPPPPPRDTTPGCGGGGSSSDDGCNASTDCEGSSCDGCEGGSCNSPTCDSDCGGSGGSGGSSGCSSSSCESCQDGDGDGTADCMQCGSGDPGGGEGDESGCGSCESGGGEGGSGCDSCGSSSGGGGGGGDCNSCSGGGSGGGGSSCGNCAVRPTRPALRGGALVAIAWVLLPLAALARAGRRERRGRAARRQP